MFSFMYKYRIPILCCIFLGLTGLGIWGAVAGLVSDRRDPLMGSYRIPGSEARIEVHYSELQDALRQLEGFRMMGLDRWIRRIFPQDYRDGWLAAWNLLVLREAAEKAGILVTQDELAQMLGMEELPGASDWRVETLRSYLLVTRYLSHYMRDPAQPTYEELYKQYRDKYEEVRVRYVTFERREPESFELDPEDEDDKKVLAEYWEANPDLKQRFPIPPRIDFEAVWINFKEKVPADPEKPDGEQIGFMERFDRRWKDVADREGITVSEEEIVQRYNANKMAYDDKAGELREASGGEDVEAGDQKTRFEWVKPWIRRELTAMKIIGRFMEKAAEVPADRSLEELAGEYDLPYGTRRRVDSTEFQKIPEFGTPAFAGPLFAQGEQQPAEGEIVHAPGGGAVPGVFANATTFTAAFRINKHHPRREPELEEVVDKVIDAWQKERAREELEERSGSFRDLVFEIAESRIADVVTEAEKEAERKIEERIAEQELDPDSEEDEARIEEIRRLYRSEARKKIEEARAPHEAEAFVKAVTRFSEEHGEDLPLDRSPWLSSALRGSVSYPEGILPAEKRARMVRDPTKVQRLKGVKEGRISDVIRDDRAGAALVAQVLEMRKPTVQDFYEAEKAGSWAVRSLVSQLSSRPSPGVAFQELAAPEAFDIRSQEAQERLKQREESRRRRAERRARERARRLRLEQDRAPPKKEEGSGDEKAPGDSDTRPSGAETRPSGGDKGSRDGG